MKFAEWLAWNRTKPGIRSVCICGTAWQLQSAFTDEKVAEILKGGLNLTIFDEASQIPLLDAAAVLRNVSRKDGRIVSCGDHKQLPPVRKGKYPDPQNFTVASRRLAKRMNQSRRVPDVDVAGVVPENFGIVVRYVGPGLPQEEGNSFRGTVVSMKEYTGTRRRRAECLRGEEEVFHKPSLWLTETFQTSTRRRMSLRIPSPSRTFTHPTWMLRATRSSCTRKALNART